MSKLSVAVQALRTDADLWDGTSQDLLAAKGETEALSLTYSQLSWAGETTGLIDTYAQLQSHIAKILGEGGKNYQDLSVTLDKVAMAYETDDAKAAKQFDEIWEINE